MADPDIFVWLERQDDPSDLELYRAATIVADRLCGAVANPIIRNAQERRQLDAIRTWLTNRGYTELPAGEGTRYDTMQPGTFAFRLNMPAKQPDTDRDVNIPIDAVIMPQNPGRRRLPLLVEAKSAGDFANVNKRRKEEATKVQGLSVVIASAAWQSRRRSNDGSPARVQPQRDCHVAALLAMTTE